MVTLSFLKRANNKLVHVDYINAKGELRFEEGVMGYTYDNDAREFLIDIEADMDCTTISAKSIRRIYIKTQIKKKSMEEIQKEFVCPKCESNEHLAFGAESATCTKCNSSYDLGLKKFQ